MPKPASASSSRPKSTVKPLSAPRKVLYRKYRPTSLDEVVGQEQITTALKNAIKQQKIGHAYLFIGPRGTGKTSVARIFAHAVNNFPYNLEDDYLDIIEIDAASNTGVDNIRELREKAIIAPTSGRYKVYIIDEVHMLSKSAANALLKTLEEPPEHVIFIMATTEINKVPITISSRTQIHTFRLADPETMFTHLHRIAELEKIPIDDDALKIVVQRGGGSFRDSLSLLDQITTLTDQTITAPLLNQALGLPEETILNALLTAYEARDLNVLRDQLQNLLNLGFSAELIAAELLDRILKSPEPALLPLLKQLTTVEAPFPEAKLLLALCGELSAMPERPISSRPAPSAVLAASQNPAPSSASAAPEPTLPPVTPPTPSPAPTAAPSSASANFDWNDFLDKFHAEHNALYLQLQKCDHDLSDQTLHIYPAQKFAEKVFQKPENNQILTANLPDGFSLLVHNLNDHPTAKDVQLSQISAIMGEVREIKGDMPF